MLSSTRSHAWRPITVILTVFVVAGAFVAGSSGGARAVSPDIVISEVYGGGGNAGAILRNDFIELFNRGTAAVDVTGWSVQYASATGSSWQATNLSGVIQPGRSYLVQEAAGTGGTADLPAPDATGSIAMSATSGKVALVTSTTLLTCGAAAGNCFPNPAIRDFVGYGTATNFEGMAAAPTLTNTTAAQRAANGCTDTDQNGTDFAAVAPTPRNSASPATPCSATPSPSPSGSPSPTPTAMPSPTPTATPVPVHIREIQGTAHLSPRVNQMVAGVPGVVTVVRGNSFYMQDPEPDANPATSEGILVFTGSAPTVRVGDAVRINGRVTEFRPGGETDGRTNLTTTEITSPVVTVTASNQMLPPPVLIGPGGRVPPTTMIDDDATGNVETSGVFDPATDGINFYESLEGMRVELRDAVVVGPTNDFGEIMVLGGNDAGQGPRTARGGIQLRPNDPNPERVLLDDAIIATPRVSVGDRFATILGVLDYSFGNFKLLITQPFTPIPGNLARESSRPPRANELAIATFNVENLDPSDPQTKFDALAQTIVTSLGAPQIVALEEVQDNNGAVNDAVVEATQTLDLLVQVIERVGGPRYEYRLINPVDDQDGGEPGGNIRVAFLFREDQGLRFIDRPGGGPTTPTTVVGRPGRPELSFSPGRIDPLNPAFQNSRKPLVGEFRYRGEMIFLIANHFNSKGGDDPLFGRFQPPQRPSETQRHQQAQIVNDFVDRILALDRNANVVVLGDLNDFEFSRTLEIVRGGVLFNLVETLPVNERYTYVFEGNSQVLDHILLSGSLFQGAAHEYDIVHINSEFADQVSDHDPQVVRLRTRGGDGDDDENDDRDDGDEDDERLTPP